MFNKNMVNKVKHVVECVKGEVAEKCSNVDSIDLWMMAFLVIFIYHKCFLFLLHILYCTPLLKSTKVTKMEAQ